MASHADEDVPSRSHSESSDDSDSQDSEDMRKDTTGPRKSSDGKAKKPVNKDPNRVKRKKARRACENCQRAHLTCSKSLSISQIPCRRNSYISSQQVTSGHASVVATRKCAKMGRGRRQSTWTVLQMRI